MHFAVFCCQPDLANFSINHNFTYAKKFCCRLLAEMLHGSGKFETVNHSANACELVSNRRFMCSFEVMI